MKNLVNLLKIQNKTISTMESCTGGSLVNEITNIEGASDILKFSAITYSNDFKIKMGVNKDIINKHSVYSIETAKEMGKNISLFTNSNYGIGITGKLNRIDKNNLHSKDNKVYISIYNRDEDEFNNYTIEVNSKNREKNKTMVIDYIKEILISILENNENR